MESLIIVDGLVELSDGLIAIDFRCETLMPPSVRKIISRFMCFDIAHMEESGNDFRIITRGTWPEGIPLRVEADEFTGIVHTDGHFPASEDVFAGENKVKNAQPQIDWLARKVFMAPLNAWQADAALLTEDAIRWMVMREDACGGYDEKREGTTLKGKELRKLLYGHFRKGQTIGLHPQDAEWNCRWFGFDLDCKPDYPNRDEVAKRNTAYGLEIARRLRLKGLHPLIESSNGIGGLHIWVKLDRKIPVPAVWCFAQEIMADNAGHGFTETPETFPKSKQKTTFGNWLRLPGKHHKLDHWSYFLNEDGSPMTLDESVQAWLELPESNADLIPDAPAEPERAKPKPKPTVSLDSLGAGLGAVKTAEKHIESIPWPDLLKQFDWKTAGDTKWTRPGKESGTSGNLHHSEKHGAVMFTVFTSSVPGVEPHKYSKWRFYVHSLGLKDDINGQLAAARTLFGDPEVDRLDKEHQRAYMKAKEIQSQADISSIVNDDLAKSKPSGSSLYNDDPGGMDDSEVDEEFCKSMIPKNGLIRDLFNFYWNYARRRTVVAGLASSVGLLQTLFGRKMKCQGIVTNAFNIVVGDTATGKDDPLKMITEVLGAVPGGKELFIVGRPGSASGFINAFMNQPCSVSIQDEIGENLSELLNEKPGSPLAALSGFYMMVQTSALSRYFSGGLFAAGSKEIPFPHSCIFGTSTLDVFRTINAKQIAKGLGPRISYWIIRSKGEVSFKHNTTMQDSMRSKIEQWVRFQPKRRNPDAERNGDLAEDEPDFIEIGREGDDAIKRWQNHVLSVHEKLDSDGRLRKEIWSRSAVRAMNLAIVHFAARMEHPDDIRHCKVEMQDVNWGIALSNWLSNSICRQFEDTFSEVDAEVEKMIEWLAGEVAEKGKVAHRTLSRKFRGVSDSAIRAGLMAHQRGLVVRSELQPERGGKKVVSYSRMISVEDASVHP